MEYPGKRSIIHRIEPATTGERGDSAGDEHGQRPVASFSVTERLILKARKLAA
jgi:hypothetical protein